MSLHARRARSAMLFSASLVACGASTGANKDGGAASARDAASSDGAIYDGALHDGTLDATSVAPDAAPAPPPPGCVPRAGRTYVGFSPGMTLEDFELAAIESDRIMKLIDDELCARADVLDPSGALAADLTAHRLELYEVLFTRDDAGAADVGLRPRAQLDAGQGAGYRVAVERRAAGWQILAVTR